MEDMNADQVAALRALLAPTGWLARTSQFAGAPRHSARTPHGLLIVGPACDEPWHLTAHLADESRLAGIPELEPTLVRWAPPRGAPAHLSVGLDRLRETGRRETLLVVTPRLAPAELLERVDDVRRLGATIFTMDRGDPELDSLAHETLAVPEATAPVSFDAAQHLVSAEVGEAPSKPAVVGTRSRSRYDPRRPGHPGRQAGWPGGSGLRDRLARLLDTVTGTGPD
jgi:hypothetical protein